ncbi:MAG TPA: hypothetical protein PLD20_15395 [Blastocatellia bacterium]|nr:hypothetical protein [Blastocatellia bacterium]HMV86318.1 hypothetical protein [Blastocatellia bacterium]HMX25959.1 hypothetical protein [Blastocatellia bacterium]HMY73296.1 hypothetical protein [Blastocatellia bacterium]HMZ19320.1 hypothetical protein [Blastocatellia bacterium]
MRKRQNHGALGMFCFFSLFAIFTVVANAQYKPKKDDPQCRLGDLRFQYPPYFILKSVKGEENKTIFLKHKDGEEHLFVSLLDSSASLGQAVENIREKLVAEVFPNGSENFRWKKVENVFWGYSGEYDAKQEKWQGFNGQKRFLLEYHLLNYRKKNILVGYAFVMNSESAVSAKAAFDKNLDAGSGTAGAGCSTVISSITKDPEISIGMPPPEMAPPKTKN